MNQKMKDILRPTIKELRDMIFMLRKNALTMAAVIALILILVIALLAPVIVPYPQDIADKTNLSEKFQPPSSAHLFGTDELGRDVFSRVLYGTRISLSTAVLAVALSLVIGVPLGGRISISSSLLYDVPNVTGMLILDCILTGSWGLLGDAFVHIIMPGFTIALYPIGLVARMTRSALLEILNEDYITAAKSYGVREGKVLWRYALKNSLGATATVVALSMGYSLTNTFLTETIFSWPGLGSYVSKSVTTLDYPAIMGIAIISAIFYVILNLVADIIIALDPRIRL